MFGAALQMPFSRGVQASFLSAGTNADVGQNTGFNHLTQNILYTMLCVR